MELKEQKSQFKILIVDDDPEMRLAMHIRLKANDYAVGFAFDGVSAIAEACRQRPDVILLDLGLPAGDGFTVMERLRGSNNLAGIPIIVVSGRDRAANASRSLVAGAQYFLQKPVRNSDLLLAIEKVLGTNPPDGPVVYNISGSARMTELDARPESSVRKPAA